MTPLSNDTQYVAKLQLVERQIADNELQLAAQDLNALFKAQPQDPRVLLLGACLARANNNHEGEFQLAVKAHHSAPQWAPATIYLAGVLSVAGQTEQALAMAEQATQQTSDASHKGEVLLKAAAVARQSGNHEKTLHWLRLADELQTGMVDIRYKLAMTLIAVGDYAGAIDILSPEITSHPTLAALLCARFTAYLGAKKPELALSDALAMVALEPDNETYAFYLAFARGDNPSKFPPSLMGQHFDEFSSTFDQHMVVGLKYTLPRDVAQMIQAWHPDKKVDVLDLGCGTGLLGACLGPMEGVLVGVELSTEMIRQAHQHGVYHRFHQVDLLDALQATPADLYHVIAALDVLIYFGELNGLVKDAYRILLAGGRFVFSCESDPEDNKPFTLQSTFRFRHSQSYVARLLEQAGFVDVAIEQRAIRLEAGEPVLGLLVTACKPLNPVQKKAVRKAPASSKSAK